MGVDFIKELWYNVECFQKQGDWQMNEKLRKKLECILDFYAIDTDRDAIGQDLWWLIEDAYLQGWSDAKDDSEEEAAFG